MVCQSNARRSDLAGEAYIKGKESLPYKGDSGTSLSSVKVKDGVEVKDRVLLK